jgi:hypothetical protein
MNPWTQYLKIESLMWLHRRLTIKKRIIESMINDPDTIDLATLQYELQVITAKLLGVEVAMLSLVAIDHLWEIEKACRDNNLSHD